MSSGVVAVTGLGVLAPLGVGREAFSRCLAAGAYQPREPRLFDASIYETQVAAEVPEFDLKQLVETPKTYLDRCSALTLAACFLAVRDASLPWQDSDADRRGLSHGTAFGCLDSLLAVTGRMRRQGTRAASPMIFTHAFVNSPASLAAIEYSLRGSAATFADGSLSGAEAVAYGQGRVAAGDVDFCLAGGAEALSEALYAALDEEGEAGDGFVPAEGAAMLVLEPPERAERRGARPLGLLLGCAVAGSAGDARAVLGAREEDVWEPPVDWGDAFGAQFPLLLSAALCAPDARDGDRLLVVLACELGAAAALVEVAR